MIRNYFKMAFRNLVKQKSFTLINIIGMAVSLSACILILLWIKDEWQMDKFHEKKEQLYRVKRTIPLGDGRYDVYNGIPYPVLREGTKSVPGIESFVCIGRSENLNLTIDNKDFRASGTFGNSDLFNALTFPVLSGSIANLDVRPDVMVLSRSLAERIFGSAWETKAIGSSLHIHNHGDFMVDAVYEDQPNSSSIRQDFYYSFAYQLAQNQWLNDWGNSGMQGALLLTSQADPDQVASKLNDLFQSNIGGELKEGVLLQKFSDHYLYNAFDDQAKADGGRIEYVRIFFIAALFLLLISCINFINLTTAVASNRDKEIGMRKIIGASKVTLIKQFMVESGVITLISILVAMVLSFLLLPAVNTITQKQLEIAGADQNLWIGLGVIFIITTFLAGAYPAFVMSSFNPLAALRKKTDRKISNISMRKILVVSQFVIALLMITGAIIVKKQVEFIQNKNLGIRKDNLVYIDKETQVTENIEPLINELKGSEGILDVTAAGPSPLNMIASTSGVVWPGKTDDQENIEFGLLWTSSNFAEVFEIPMAYGTYYRKGEKSDPNHIVLNETAIALMKIEDPIGKQITWWSQPREIIGVVKDFHNYSLYEEIGPAGFILDDEGAANLFVKIDPLKTALALNNIEKAFTKIIPGMPLHYDFLDEEYKQLYLTEIMTGKIINYFALISILISALGLLGMSIFIARQRNKEISIRKVLGASTIGIIRLISIDFLWLILISIIIAIPVAYYFMTMWLQNFSYKIELEWWMFVLGGLMALMVALVTLSIQGGRAAMVKPTKNLRAE